MWWQSRGSKKTGSTAITFSDGGLSDEEEITVIFDKDGYIRFPDGSRYKGGLSEGKPDGAGRIVYTDGTVYDGDWKQGTSHGYGVLELPDGRRYQG